MNPLFLFLIRRPFGTATLHCTFWPSKFIFDLIAIQAATNKFRPTSKVERAVKEIFNTIKDKTICEKNIVAEMRENVENFVKEAWIDGEVQFLISESF